MIVLSRNRAMSAIDSELAEALVERGGARIWSIPFLYDLRSFGPTVRRLRLLEEPFLFLAPLPIRSLKNLFLFLEIAPAKVKFVDTSNRPVEEIVADFLNEPVFSEFRGEDTTGGKIEHSEEPTVRRWYPVIDRKECTGCLECVNFCLFGVYTIGEGDLPVVDQPDACRDGCPACSRICPGGAILFPMHEDPNISGRNDAETVRFQNDSKLADRERNRHRGPSDDLDDFIDQVDRFSF